MNRHIALLTEGACPGVGVYKHDPPDGGRIRRISAGAG